MKGAKKGTIGAKRMAATRSIKAPKHKFGQALAFGALYEMAGELRELRLGPPKVKKKKGSRSGDILGFVRGLRLSARLAYFLREQISHTECDVNWGHLVDDECASCSPECDVIIHKRGQLRRWNGGDRPIMDFRFIRVAHAKLVVSCKSVLTSIDRGYPATLKKFGVKRVLLFAECCKKKDLQRLRRTAKKAGYAGVYCLYLTESGTPEIRRNDRDYQSLTNAIIRAASS